MTEGRPLPDVSNPLTAPFWRGLRDRRLLIQRCRSCDALRWPSAKLCPRCLSPALDWSEVRGEGTVWSYVVYHRAFAAAFAAAVPYAIALVDLPEGPRLPGRLSVPLDAVGVGMRVRAIFTDVTDEVTLLEWTAGPTNETD